MGQIASIVDLCLDDVEDPVWVLSHGENADICSTSRQKAKYGVEIKIKCVFMQIYVGATLLHQGSSDKSGP